MKKSICIILSILMLCTTFTGLNITVMANELNAEQANTDELAVASNGKIIGDNLSSEILYSGSFKKIQWSLDSNGLLTISGNGDMPNFDYTYHIPWDNYRDLIKKVVIKNGVTSIGDEAFSGCSGLTSITIPNSVTSIGWDAFSGCSGLTSITIPNSVTSIGRYAFCDCSGLTSIIVEDGNSVYDSRNNCNAIINTSTNCLIQGCKTTIIPNSVTSIGVYAFSGCSGLTSITIPNGVTSIGGSAFRDCSGLTSITIPNSVTSIWNFAFGGCSGLTSITIPNSVASIGYSAFSGCSGLTSIAIPNSVTSISDGAFYGCSGLTNITIPNSVTSIGNGVFYGCSGLTRIIVKDGNSVYDSRNDCNAIIETSTNCLIQGCKTTIIPNSVTSIGDNAFCGCSGLTSITIPNSVTSIGDGAFEDCSGLTRIIVEDGNSVYDSRNNCNAIIETSTNCLIQGCKTTIIPNSVTSIGDYAFLNCSELTSITIPDSVTSIGISAFWFCSGLTSITIPNSVTSIGPAAFLGCSGLTSITIPNSVTSIGYDAFYDCDSLSDVYYSGTQEQWEAIEIDDDCFGDATIHYGFSFSIGDVNLDGKINILDVTTIQKHLAQIITFNDEALALADTNGDGKINILDATQIQKYLARIIPEL